MRGCAPRAPLIPLLMRKKNNSQKAGLRRRDPQFSARAVAMISLLSLAVPGCYLAVLGLAKVWNAAGPLGRLRGFGFGLFFCSSRAGILAFGFGVAVDEFDDRHCGVVAIAIARLD